MCVWYTCMYIYVWGMCVCGVYICVCVGCVCAYKMRAITSMSLGHSCVNVCVESAIFSCLLRKTFGGGSFICTWPSVLKVTSRFLFAFLGPLRPPGLL